MGRIKMQFLVSLIEEGNLLHRMYLPPVVQYVAVDSRQPGVPNKYDILSPVHYVVLERGCHICLDVPN
jgi:hypothetical protein